MMTKTIAGVIMVGCGHISHNNDFGISPTLLCSCTPVFSGGNILYCIIKCTCGCNVGQK